MTMTRRSALAALGLAAGASAPRSATAQDARVQRLGVLSLNHNAPAFEALVDELAKLGYEPGRNLAVDYRINLDVDRLPQLAGELASLNTNVILVHGPEPPLTAVRRFAPTIPTVFVAYNYDPVRRGHVQSLARRWSGYGCVPAVRGCRRQAGRAPSTGGSACGSPRHSFKRPT
jgi:hypothetical protein